MRHKLVVPAAHLAFMVGVVVGVHVWIPVGLDQELAVLAGEQLIGQILEHWLTGRPVEPAATHELVSASGKNGRTHRVTGAGSGPAASDKEAWL